MTDFTRYMDKYYELEVKYSGDILVSEPIYIEHGKTPKTKDNSFGFTEVYSSYELAVKAAIKYAHELQFYGQEALWTDVLNGMIKRGKTEEQKIEALKQKQKVEEEPEATAETVESVEETTVSETVEETAEQETELNAEIAEVEAEQTAEPETFSYEFNEIHKITISKRNNVYVEEFFEKMGGSYVKLGEEAWGCIEDIEEYYGIKINRNVQTDTEESESESESEPTVDSNTVETYQGNINVLIAADIANTFEMITHTGYFDTS